MMTLPIISGFFAGLLVGFFNLRFLRKLTERLLNDNPQVATGGGILFFVKMILLLGVAALFILVLKVNPLAFVVGFLLVLVGFFCKESLYASRL